MVISVYEKLMKEIIYAKTSVLQSRALHETYGRITMARELDAINIDEYLKLSHQCVCLGINNPKYFEREVY